jgi:molybdate/tungstate transport system substrate-binding protein
MISIGQQLLSLLKILNYMRFILLTSLICCLLFFSCQSRKDNGSTLHIIHAGSLSYPVKILSEAFIEENPGIRILSEAWGSKAGARRVMEIDTPADVFLSADYMVIENMLIPDHASWYITFASNEMAIVYTRASRYSDQINSENWQDILLRPGVNVGRSDPDHDPCGVRSVFTCQLAEIKLQRPGLSDSLLQKAGQNLRPKETDLIALLEKAHLDYIFLYRSVAQQHKLPYLRLPAELNLGDPSLYQWYLQATTRTLGSRPGEFITEYGQAMVYGATIPFKTQNRELAEAFVEFLVSPKGIAIMEDLGQPGVVPSPNPYFNELPERLRYFASPANN